MKQYIIVSPDESPVLEVDNIAGKLKGRFTETEVINFANTLYWYDMKDNDEPEFEDIDTVLKVMRDDGYTIKEATP
jgi:hypothetical protein